MQNLCSAPTVASGSSSTYYCDGWYNDNAISGLRCPFRRGLAYHGAYAGLAYLIGYLAVSCAYVRWSSPLGYAADLFSKKKWRRDPVTGQKIKAKGIVPVG